jgi:2-amino-4-hydroxy-6-hydroxymethyldihydropteridine diphosphokinase
MQKQSEWNFSGTSEMTSNHSESSAIETDAYIAIGSNISPRENIPRALRALEKYVTICAISIFYRSAPLERPEQNDFINGVIRILTAYQPRYLKIDVLRKIESQSGRVRTADKHAARTIDLDLILYDKVTVKEDDLVLPDPSISIYPFIAVPLQELAPDLFLPQTRIPLSIIKASPDKKNLYPEEEFTEQLRATFLKQAQISK